MRWISVSSCLVIAMSAVAPQLAAREKITTAYEAGHYFATTHADGGRKLQLLVDSGGGGGNGLYVITRKATARNRLATRDCGQGEDRTLVVDLSPAQWQGLPLVADRLCDATAFVIEGDTGVAGEDGILGAGYLPRFTWTFDYPGRALWREDAGWKPGTGMRKVALGFLKNAAGTQGVGFPRVTLTIAGHRLDLLLDTGATAKPTPAGLKASGIETVHGVGVTSYITTSVLERWHREHPTWRLVQDADSLMAETRIIEVPDVEVAGWSIGPVWFTERPDGNFGSKGMSQWMDRPVVGAAGANIWQRFVMTLDYPHDAAWLACSHCKDVTGH